MESKLFRVSVTTTVCRSYARWTSRRYAKWTSIAWLDSDLMMSLTHCSIIFSQGMKMNFLYCNPRFSFPTKHIHRLRLTKWIRKQRSISYLQKTGKQKAFFQMIWIVRRISETTTWVPKKLWETAQLHQTKRDRKASQVTWQLWKSTPLLANKILPDWKKLL